MSPSVFITVRITKKSGKRYVVRYRIGGADTPLVHAGSFRTLALAKTRRDFIAGELAAGRNPHAALVALSSPPQTLTVARAFDLFAKSRVDVGASAQSQYRDVKARLGQLADLEPAQVTVADVRAWVAANSKLAPSSLRTYLGSIRQVLDFVDVEPNPARSRKVKLPTGKAPEVVPPSGREWNAIRARILDKRVLPFRLIEAEGMRITEALELTYGDLDFQAGRLRVSRARTKTGAGQRWLAVPPELLDEIAALVPLEDRHADRLIFPGLTDHAARGEMTKAAKLAGVAHYHPHDLRHRRISLWLAHGIDPITVRTWAGHSKASTSLDKYGHVVIDARDDEWRDFWLAVYRKERLPDVQRERSEA